MVPLPMAGGSWPGCFMWGLDDWMNSLLALSLRCSPIAHTSSPHWEVDQGTCTIKGRCRSTWSPGSLHGHHEQGGESGKTVTI